jgi:general secretion pathway protein F
MPVFDYLAIAPDGLAEHGRIEAVDRHAAARLLQERGRLPVELRDGLGARQPAAVPGRRRAPGDRRLRPRELARMTRGLSLLLGAGLPLDVALDALAASETVAGPRILLRALHAEVRDGAPLSAALAARQRAIPNWYGAAVAAAEGTGRLTMVLERLAAELLRAEKVAERLRAGLTYPALVLVLAAVAVCVLATVVLPALEPLFASAGNRLPASTRAMLAAAAWLRDWGPLGLATVLAALLAANRALAAEDIRRWRDAMLLRAPALGPLAWRIATARFARTLATLLGAGVPLAPAMGHAAASAGNAAIAAALLRTRDRLATGERLAAALAQEGALPRLAVTLIEIGEEGGRLRAMLEETAVIHEEETERAVERLLALLVPGATLVMGLLVSGIVLATMDAIMGASAGALGGAR